MNLFDLFPKLAEKRVTLNDLDVPYRIYVNWSEKGIIDYQVSDSATNKEVTRRRVELSYFEALWVLLIKELRIIGLSLKDLKNLKDYLFEPIDHSYFHSLSAQTISEIVEKGLPKELNYMATEDEGFNVEIIKSILENIPEDYKIYFTNLGGLVSSVLLFGHTPTLILHRKPLKVSEEATFSYNIFNPLTQDIEAKMNTRDFRDELVTNLIHHSVINIPIVPLISKFYQDEALYKYTVLFALYTPSELELLKLLKQKDFKQIKIYKSHNNETFEVEITNEQDLKNHEAQAIRTLIGLKQYQRAEIIFRNDKHLVIKNILKKQI